MLRNGVMSVNGLISTEVVFKLKLINRKGHYLPCLISTEVVFKYKWCETYKSLY